MGRSANKSPEHISNKINNQERDNTPPNSRIFIVCNKGVTEELLKKHLQNMVKSTTVK